MWLGWYRTSDDMQSVKWVCGYCGRGVGGNVGYRREDEESAEVILKCDRRFIIFTKNRHINQTNQAPYEGFLVQGA